jgi:hypothetical protein
VSLSAGDLVYRVIEVDPPEGSHTWEVASVVVRHASAKQIKLTKYFAHTWRALFEPDALGRVFFATPAAAIAAFLTERRTELETLERRRQDAERAIAWASEQGTE